MFDPPADGEVLDAACRLADTVLLCYRSNDVASLQQSVNKVILDQENRMLFLIDYIPVSATTETSQSLPASGPGGMSGGQQGDQHEQHRGGHQQ